MEQTVTNRQVIEDQLNVALRFYFENRELIPALTLAGAAEEILGKALRENNIQPALERDAKLFNIFSEIMIEKTTDKREYINQTNAARNNLKHKKDEQMTYDFKIEVRNMLKRALENYKDLYKIHHVSYEKFIQCI